MIRLLAALALLARVPLCRARRCEVAVGLLTPPSDAILIPTTPPGVGVI